MQKFHSLVVKAIINETPATKSIFLSIPLQLQHYFRFKPGQFVTLRFIFRGQEYRRCYSISSYDLSNEIIRITAQLLDKGIFSEFLQLSLKVGDEIEVSQPEGDFFLEVDSVGETKNLIAIAAGSGITPIFTIIAAALQNSIAQVILFYSSKSKELSVFREEIYQLRSTYGTRLKIYEFYSQEQVADAHFGRVSPNNILEILRATCTDSCIDGKYYICGPENLINESIETFKKNTIPMENIFFERFYTPNNTPPISAKDINTESATATVKVIIDGLEEERTVLKSEILLHSLLDAGMDIPYSCQNAICSSCVCIITKGKVKMNKITSLSNEDLEQGKILMCQAFPSTSQIELNYDIL